MSEYVNEGTGGVKIFRHLLNDTGHALALIHRVA
jgi:hypothetical protein